MSDDKLDDDLKKHEERMKKLRAQKGGSKGPSAKHSVGRSYKPKESKAQGKKPYTIHNTSQTGQQNVIYNAMSGNPVLEKIARYWGLHLTAQTGLHPVLSIVFFFLAGMVIGSTLQFLLASLLGAGLFTGLFTGLLMSVVFFVTVTMPLATRAVFYGMRWYYKMKFKK